MFRFSRFNPIKKKSAKKMNDKHNQNKSQKPSPNNTNADFRDRAAEFASPPLAKPGLIREQLARLFGGSLGGKKDEKTYSTRRHENNTSRYAEGTRSNSTAAENRYTVANENPTTTNNLNTLSSSKRSIDRPSRFTAGPMRRALQKKPMFPLSTDTRGFGNKTLGSSSTNSSSSALTSQPNFFPNVGSTANQNLVMRTSLLPVKSKLGGFSSSTTNFQLGKNLLGLNTTTPEPFNLARKRGNKML